MEEEKTELSKVDVSKAESFHKSRLEADLKERSEQGEPCINVEESEKQSLYLYGGKAETERQRLETD